MYSCGGRFFEAEKDVCLSCLGEVEVLPVRPSVRRAVCFCVLSSTWDS